MNESQPLAPNDGEQGSPSGSKVNAVYTDRKVTWYPVSDSEVATITSLNITASVYLALASFLLSSAIGIYTNAAFYDNLNASGKLAQSYVAPTVIVIGSVFLAFAIFNAVKSSKLWGEIKKSAAERV